MRTHQDADAVADAGDSGVTDWMPLEPLGENGEYFPVATPDPMLDRGPGVQKDSDTKEYRAPWLLHLRVRSRSHYRDLT